MKSVFVFTLTVDDFMSLFVQLGMYLGEAFSHTLCNSIVDQPYMYTFACLCRLFVKVTVHPVQLKSQLVKQLLSSKYSTDKCIYKKNGIMVKANACMVNLHINKHTTKCTWLQNVSNMYTYYVELLSIDYFLLSSSYVR
mgnify:FL=1